MQSQLQGIFSIQGERFTGCHFPSSNIIVGMLQPRLSTTFTHFSVLTRALQVQFFP